MTDFTPTETDGPPTKRSEPIVKSSGQSTGALQTGRSIGETPKFKKEPTGIKSSMIDEMSQKKDFATAKVTVLINQN